MDISQGASVARELIGRRGRRERRLINALEAYELHPGSTSTAMELEVSFRGRYGKYLPAALIHRMAKVPWGPQKAFEAYARANSSVSCDFMGHKITIGRFANLNFAQEQVRFLGVALLLVICVIVLVAISYLGIKVYHDFNYELLAEANFNQYLKFATLLGFAGMGIVFSMMFGWLSIQALFINDRTGEAIKLAEILEAQTETSQPITESEPPVA